MFGLPDTDVLRRAERLLHDGEIIAAVCHGPAASIGPRTKAVGPSPKNATLLPSPREIARGTTGSSPAVPAGDALKELGALVRTAPLWSDHVVVDGLRFTGQNPPSGGTVAREAIELLD